MASKPKTKPLIDTKGFTFEPDTHTYRYDGKEMTGMTTILGVLNKPALIVWAVKMAIESLLKNLPALAQAWLAGDTKRVDEILEEAKNAHRKTKEDAAQKGTDTHALIEEYVKECIDKYRGEPKLIDYLYTNIEEKKLENFATWAIKEKVKFLASEGQVYSKELFVAGTFDLLFEKNGKRYLGDIKTYKKIWDRVPFFQCAGYAYCWEEMNTETLIHKEETIDGYCIINLPKEREFDEIQDVLWSWDIEGDTEAFLSCVKIYRQLANFKTKNNYATHHN